MSDIGAIELGRWQFWQLRWSIGAISFVKVGPPVAVPWPDVPVDIVTAMRAITAAISTPRFGARRVGAFCVGLIERLLSKSLCPAHAMGARPEIDVNYEDRIHLRSRITG